VVGETTSGPSPALPLGLLALLALTRRARRRR
jgi:MYXO-CTERM domain-containing protein